jgi:hypothetical protein
LFRERNGKLALAPRFKRKEVPAIRDEASRRSEGVATRALHACYRERVNTPNAQGERFELTAPTI